MTVDEEDLSLGMLAELEAESRDYIACVVAEPTDMSTVIACRGAANFKITVTGSAAHAGRPEDGVNAITAASRIALLIAGEHERLRAGSRGLLGSASWSVGVIQAAAGATIVPDRCELLVNRRLMPGETRRPSWSRCRSRSPLRARPRSSRDHACSSPAPARSASSRRRSPARSARPRSSCPISRRPAARRR